MALSSSSLIGRLRSSTSRSQRIRCAISGVMGSCVAKRRRRENTSTTNIEVGNALNCHEENCYVSLRFTWIVPPGVIAGIPPAPAGVMPGVCAGVTPPCATGVSSQRERLRPVGVAPGVSATPLGVASTAPSREGVASHRLLEVREGDHKKTSRCWT